MIQNRISCIRKNGGHLKLGSARSGRETFERQAGTTVGRGTNDHPKTRRPISQKVLKKGTKPLGPRPLVGHFVCGGRENEFPSRTEAGVGFREATEWAPGVGDVCQSRPKTGRPGRIDTFVLERPRWGGSGGEALGNNRDHLGGKGFMGGYCKSTRKGAVF